MGSTNKTQNLDLSQFVGVDKPSWLNDYNSDMQKIDQAYGNFTGVESNLRDDINKNTADISTLKTNVNALQVEQNTQEQTITGIQSSITSLSNEVGDNSADIAELQGEFNKIGGGDWIMLGDDLGANSPSYFNYVQSILPDKKIYTSARVGAGLVTTTNSFYNMLTTIAATVTDKNKVSNIIIIGGQNDYDLIGQADFENALNQISLYAKTNFPNAQVNVGVTVKNKFNDIDLIDKYNSVMKDNLSYLNIYEDFYFVYGVTLQNGLYALTIDGAKLLANAIISRVNKVNYVSHYKQTIVLDNEYLSTYDFLFTVKQDDSLLLLSRNTSVPITVKKTIPVGNLDLGNLELLKSFEISINATLKKDDFSTVIGIGKQPNTLNTIFYTPVEIAAGAYSLENFVHTYSASYPS